MVPCVLRSYKITFSLVVIVTAWQGDLSRAFSEGGVGEKVNFKMCNISLKSNVFFTSNDHQMLIRS